MIETLLFEGKEPRQAFLQGSQLYTVFLSHLFRSTQIAPLWRVKKVPYIFSAITLSNSIVQTFIYMCMFLTNSKFLEDIKSDIQFLKNILWLVYSLLYKIYLVTCLEVQWLRLCSSTAGNTNLIPNQIQGTKTPHVIQYGYTHIQYITCIYIYIHTHIINVYRMKKWIKKKPQSKIK